MKTVWTDSVDNSVDPDPVDQFSTFYHIVRYGIYNTFVILSGNNAWILMNYIKKKKEKILDKNLELVDLNVLFDDVKGLNEINGTVAALAEMWALFIYMLN